MNRFHKAFLMSPFLLLPFEVFAFDFNFGKKYLDYGNGAINLDLVTHIIPKWEYQYTHPGNDPTVYFEKYNETPDKKTVETRIKELFNVEIFETLEFYYLSNKSYITFDLFTLEILTEKIYFKMPDCSLIRTVISKRPDLAAFLTKSMEVFLIDANSGNACEQLAEKQNKLTKKAVSELEDGLLETIAIYQKVVRR